MPIHCEGFLAFACIQPAGSDEVVHTLASGTKQAYLQLVQRSGYRGPTEQPAETGKTARLRVAAVGGGAELVLDEGDAAFVKVGKGGARELSLTNEGGKEAEWVLLEMA